MTGLTSADFPAFLAEVHERKPFPWQQRLVEKVLAEGRWPDVLDVPTGLGKTTVIDAAVFVAAADPALGRRRLFFVVDRRLIVDEAYDHATRMANALKEPRGDVSKRVSTALRISEELDPLQVTRMRGGVTWSWRWLDRPDRHAVIVGTIDQVGSRLLFRGYGVGEHLRPIDAALVGTDSLIVVDEAHLARPFLETVTAACADEPTRTHQKPIVMRMSATVASRDDSFTHGTDEDDEQDEVAGPRLRVRRRLHLLRPRPPATSKNATTVIPSTMAAWAMALADTETSGRVVGVICNTVARARHVFERLPGDRVDRLLLTGRIRPVDREYLLAEWYDRIRAGRERMPGKPLILVATQTIEVGANIDLDALVTESAALPALVQRLGRLNRLARPEDSHALVVHDPSVGSDDPVYGPAREATWTWLTSLADPITPRPGARPDVTLLSNGLDVCPLALRRLQKDLPPKDLPAMRPPEPYLPVLDANTIDAWTRTSPAPHSDPPVAPYLHGLGRGRRDVAIVWRSGLPANPNEWKEALQSVPPVIDEALEAPLPAVRRWLAGAPDAEADVTDVEGQPDTDDPDLGLPSGLIAIRYSGPRQDPEPLRATDVRAGDLIVVRAESGGCDRFGWNPASAEPATDVADLVQRRDHPLLRLRREFLATVEQYHPDLVPAMDALVTTAENDARDEGLNPHVYRRALKEIPDSRDLPLLCNLRTLARGCTAVAELGPGEAITVLLAQRGGGQRGDEEEMASSANGSGKQIKLMKHQRAVAARAAEIGRNLGLPTNIIDAVAKAAELHDEGKQDPRFQAMLYERPFAAHFASSFLAKSGIDPADHDRRYRAWKNSEYPSGMRHEALSARMARLALKDNELDTELIVHLVAAHHGRNRPLLPPVADPEPIRISYDSVDLSSDETVDWASPRRFAELADRYGRWGLALLESIVRLADIWCSEREEEG